MITSVFKKSTIINYSLVVILVLVFYFLYITSSVVTNKVSISNIKNLVIALLLVASLFLVNFIGKKNGLTKNSSYAIFFFFLFLILFPAVFSTLNLVIANFFLLLATRRLISLQTLNSPKEKIFDASIWIFVASLFHFWCILFIFLVYVSIIFHASRDYRNWLIPFVAFVITVILFLFMALLIDKSWIYFIIQQAKTDFRLDYFTNNFQNIALTFYAILALYFCFSMIFSITKKPLVLQSTYKKMVFAFLIGILVFLISPEKNNTILLFTFFPLSIMATNTIEYSKNKMYQEILLSILIAGSFFVFFSQL